MQREQRGTLAEVKEQVANTHSTNLREDIDNIAHSVEQINTRLDRLEKNALQRLVGRLI
jgi:ubiquinone biosynthesis protein UbiJ